MVKVDVPGAVGVPAITPVVLGSCEVGLSLGCNCVGLVSGSSHGAVRGATESGNRRPRAQAEVAVDHRRTRVRHGAASKDPKGRGRAEFNWAGHCRGSVCTARRSKRERVGNKDACSDETGGASWT